MVLAADHVIEDEAKLLQLSDMLKEYAANGKLVTFGVFSLRAGNGLWYIRRVVRLIGNDAYAVAEFVEKPDIDTMVTISNQGKYYWNSGIFFISCKLLFKQLKIFIPEIYQLVKSVRTCKSRLDFIRIDKRKSLCRFGDSID